MNDLLKFTVYNVLVVLMTVNFYPVSVDCWCSKPLKIMIY